MLTSLHWLALAALCGFGAVALPWLIWPALLGAGLGIAGIVWFMWIVLAHPSRARRPAPIQRATRRR